MINIIKVSTKDWLFRHADHNKTNKEITQEFFFYPTGSATPTKKMIFVLKRIKCEDCKEVLFYDTAIREVKFMKGGLLWKV